MNNLREKLITTLYEFYDRETQNMSFACRKGCSTCCTKSVTMTATEGEIIMAHLKAKGQMNEIHEILKNTVTTNTPKHTPNQFVKKCLEKKECQEESWDLTPCCFLDNGSCSIYSVRPFSCRSFGSTVQCDLNQTAELPPLLLTKNTVMMQVFEHVGQGEYWGNMLDILLELSSQSRYIGRQWQGEGSDKVDRARFRMLTAEPVPGFIVPPDHEETLHDLLGRISNTEVYKTTIGTLIGM